MLERLRTLEMAPIMQWVVLGALLMSLSASSYFLMREDAGEKVLKRFDYSAERLERPDKIRPEWRARIAALELVATFHVKDAEVMRKRIALFFMLGFVATCLVYVVIDRRSAAFMMLGTFAALFYCATPRAEDTWYPWDMPALFFGALTLLLALRRATIALAVVVLIAVPFKETIFLMGLFPLFYEGRSLRWRAAWAGGIAVAALLLRAGIQRAIGGAVKHAHFLHVHGKPEREYRFMDNFGYVFEITANHVIWTNVGLWLLVFLIPARDRVLAGFKWIALAFYGAQLLLGSFNEYRIFLEVLPGSLLLAHQLFARDPGEAQMAAPGRSST